MLIHPGYYVIETPIKWVSIEKTVESIIKRCYNTLPTKTSLLHMTQVFDDLFGVL